MAEARSGPSEAGSDVDFVALSKGDKVGRYEILAVLGQGGFGITYSARDLQLEREVAIKEYLPTSLAVRRDGATVLPRSTKVAEDFTWGRERFVAEGRTLATLHEAPAIVRVFDFLEVNGTAYIVMELVRGETLEMRLRQKRRLSPQEVDTILWPLLDGLEQVHGAGFLHRDIKPGNILLRADGRPILIDFGASRAAMAGRTTAMTAIFTPGYAAAEQMTSAKQGPWTDIYGLSATIYHAITGAAPPSAFDRMLDDQYAPVTKAAPPGFAPSLLVGIDAGLAVRASDRPQSIAGWRPLLGQAAAIGGGATVVLTKPEPAPPPPPAASAPPAPEPAPAPAASAMPDRPKSRIGLYAGALAAVAVLVAAGGYFALAPKAPQTASVQDMKVEELEKVLEARRKADAEAAEKRRAEEEALRKAAADAEAKRTADSQVERAQAERVKAEQELARLRAEVEEQRRKATEQRLIAEAEEARRKAEAEMASLRQAEEDARRKAAAEAEAKRLADEALAKAQEDRRKAEAEEEAKRKLEAEAKAKADAETNARAQAEADRKAAEAAEAALRLGVADRQRVQVALTSLGFDTRGSDGAFGARSREMVAAWQKARNQPTTGFLNGTQHQALLREAAPALQRFDDEQKRLDEERKKAEEAAKAKAAATPAPAPTPPPAAAAPVPAPAAASFDGNYTGTLIPGGGGYPRPGSLRITNNVGNGNFAVQRCGASTISIRVAPSGQVSGEGTSFDQNCAPFKVSVTGRVANGQLQIIATGNQTKDITGTLTLQR